MPISVPVMVPVLGLDPILVSVLVLDVVTVEVNHRPQYKLLCLAYLFCLFVSALVSLRLFSFPWFCHSLFLLLLLIPEFVFECSPCRMSHLACHLSSVSSRNWPLATRLSTGIQCPLSSVRYKCFTWATAGDILIRFVTNILISYVEHTMQHAHPILCGSNPINRMSRWLLSLVTVKHWFETPNAVSHPYYFGLINVYLNLLPYFKIK